MESKELRIENLVTYYGKIVSITGITEEHPFIYLITADYLDWDEIEPILITEQWLFKFGFKQEKNKYWFSNEVISISVHKDGYYNIWGNSGREIARKGIKYVHQLQNLYFALVGKELQQHLKSY